MSILNKLKSDKILFFIFVLTALVLTKISYIDSYDAEMIYRTTKSLVENGNITIEDELFHVSEPYSRYGIGQAIIQVPLYIAGKIFFTPAIGVSFLNQIVVAVSVVVLMQFLLLFQFNKKQSYILSSIFCFGTMIWPYSKYLFTEPIVMLLTLSSCYYLVKFHFTKENKYLSFSAISVGASVLFKESSIIIVPCQAIYLYLILFRCSNNTGSSIFKSIKVISTFIGILLIFILIEMRFNLYRYNSVFNAGYEYESFTSNIFNGLFGLTISTGKGFFVFSPILIVSLLGIVDFYKRYFKEFVLFMSIILVYTLFFANWGEWRGGSCWGPRFLVPIIPYFIILLGHSFRKFKIMSIAILPFSFIVQLAGITYNYAPYINETNETYGAFWGSNMTSFIPSFSPIIENLKMLFNKQPPDFFITQGSYQFFFFVTFLLLLISGIKISKVIYDKSCLKYGVFIAGMFATILVLGFIYKSENPLLKKYQPSKSNILLKEDTLKMLVFSSKRDFKVHMGDKFYIFSKTGHILYHARLGAVAISFIKGKKSNFVTSSEIENKLTDVKVIFAY